ncbi:MAG: hypothetical protein WAS24_07430 [Thermoplasmata archaeon]
MDIAVILTGMAQRIYITMTGISKWPVLNSLWAAICCKGYLPDKIYLFVTLGRENDARSLSEWIRTLTESYGKRIEPVLRTIDEGDFTSSGKKITAVMEEERAAGNEVAIDITPGRKAIISSALLSAWQKQVDHVYYLYLEDMRNATNPYPMIPFHLQHFVDLKEEVWK